MKTQFKHLCLAFLLIVTFSCDNDDGNAPNTNGCAFAGLTVVDSGGNIVAIFDEANLQTDYFPNNDGPNMAAVEVFETTNPGDNFIVTRALTVGAIDTNPEIRINNVDYTGTITCQLAGSAVGQELRFDIIVTGLGEAELCVIIDNVTP